MVARYFAAISSRISEIGIMPAAFISSMKPRSVKAGAERAARARPCSASIIALPVR